ncbi:glutamate racemase [Flammeovirga sp. EKP202]|uniref:glutamate racemase n=1 Tax=Flammeovirga sp. EKP202 TaxID=2770592 RepID=UPI00165F60A9|nr:glutamate racemase [Flammeovirga sp. EKP202]MBD0401020.1 glutamate racemase [Flammeovirga sp. EKP202]
MIAFFDSGLGGLSVWKTYYQQVPQQSMLYFADQKYIPYGSKTKEELIDRAIKITDFLISKGATIIVVACNTATAAVIKPLREKYSIPFVGMEPAIKPAAISSQTKSIGVLATEGTFSGELFQQTKEKFTKGINVIVQPGYGMVELVEEGLMRTPKAKELLEPLVHPMLKENVDHIVLGCTHYPFLKDDLQEIVGEKVQLIDPSPAVVKQINRLLPDPLLNKEAKYQFYTSSPNVVSFQAGVEKLIGKNIKVDYQSFDL